MSLLLYELRRRIPDGWLLSSGIDKWKLMEDSSQPFQDFGSSLAPHSNAVLLRIPLIKTIQRYKSVQVIEFTRTLHCAKRNEQMKKRC